MASEEERLKWSGIEFGRLRARLDLQQIQIAGLSQAVELLTASLGELELLMKKLTTPKQRKTAKKRIKKEMDEKKVEREESRIKEVAKGLTVTDMMHKYGGFKP